MDLNNLTKNEIGLIICGLDYRNRHNIQVLNNKGTPKGVIKSCMDECNEIENLKSILSEKLRKSDEAKRGE